MSHLLKSPCMHIPIPPPNTKSTRSHALNDDKTVTTERSPSLQLTAVTNHRSRQAQTQKKYVRGPRDNDNHEFDRIVIYNRIVICTTEL